ncbi:ARM repeat-containing protein [Cubamyces sp. BRFM 1775]|nr:ARM repeat-containing protein [Cubamyces sp. BRFM 1775]
MKDTLAQVTQERLDMLTSAAQFDAVSDEIITWMNLGTQELGGSAIECMLVPICEKAISGGPGEGDSEVTSQTYARLCGKMMGQVDPNMKDDNMKDSNGQPVVGEQLFRRILNGWCREAVERLWPEQEAEPSATTTAQVASEDQAPKGETEQDAHITEAPLPEPRGDSDAETKSRRLRLVVFLCELFKLRVVAERPVHECIKEILSNAETAESPDEEEVEGLCKMWTAIGQLLDSPRAAAHINAYIGNMAMLSKSPQIPSRIRLMLLDVIDLRERKWVPHDPTAVTTMSDVLDELIQTRKEAIAEKYATEYAKLQAGRLRARPRRVVQGGPSSTPSKRPLRSSCESPPSRLLPGGPRCGPILSPPVFSLIKPTSASTPGLEEDDKRPSAMATARAIRDISSIEYPEGVKGPKPELNDLGRQGRFRYDLDFLLQFKDVCTMKPDSLRLSPT